MEGDCWTQDGMKFCWICDRRQDFAGLDAAVADTATNEKVKLVVNSVKGHPTYGENSDLYRAMGSVTVDDRATGLTRKSKVEQPVEPTVTP